ncbi:unnamed protein product [Oreochromis niloticus]|nr:unnamed protein product [Mustela putorius furo]
MMGNTLLALFLFSTFFCGNAEDSNGNPAKATTVETRTATSTELEIKATLRADNTTIPAGGSVTLTCDLKHSGDFEYQWFTETSSKSRCTLEVGSARQISISKGGIYSCRGRRKNLNSLTIESDPVTIQETDKPKAKLRADNTAVPVGGSVTLTCSVNPSSSSGWKYYWYRNNTPVDVVSHSNGQISVSQEGLYRCRGGRGNPVYYTEDSQSVRIDKTVSIRPVVTLYPNWSETYRGETITVRCEIHGGDTEWDYEWETNSMIKAPNQNEYRIRSASSSNSGNYRCKGRMKSSQHKTTEWSDSVTLTVSDNKPRPVLTVSPSWLSPGASVTLNCEVEHPSAGWSFYWYKAVPDLSEKSSSYELLPDGSGTAQDSYIIHGQTHTAGYVCRAGRGDPEYHTDHSQPKFVWSADVHSAATLKVIPDSVQNLMYASVSLTCEGNFTEWRVKRFPSDGPLYYSNCGRMTGSTCNISYILTGVYWCESGSGEFSNAVNITVQITVAPSGPESSSFPLWLVGLVCGVSLLIILLLLGMSILYCYRKVKDLCFTGPIQSDIKSQDSTRSHGDNQDATHEYKSLQHAHYEPYETVHLAEETANGPNGDNHDYETIADLEETANRENEADKAHEGTYSLIELKNSRKNTRKHHKPHESALSTDVNMENAGQ